MPRGPKTEPDQQQRAGPSRSVDSQSTVFGDINTYPDGSIIHIIYSSFLTYDYVTCSPGSRLNVIIGTNGSGKSSIICGICLALGGSAKTLGRSERLGDYIKHGSKEGFVEVHIRDSTKGTQLFKIVITEPNSAHYFYNNNPISQRDLRVIVAAYNIQVDNLCTFLAQDKVKSFSEQNQIVLLENTLKAASVELLAERDRLIQKQKHETEMEGTMVETRRRMAQVEAEIQTLEPRVENYRKKKALQSRIVLINQKKAIMGYTVMRNRYDTEKENLNHKKDEVANALSYMNEKDKEIEEKKKRKKCHEDENLRVRNQIKERRHEYQTLVHDCTFREKLEECDRQLTLVKEKAEKWEHTVAKAKASMNSKLDAWERSKEECKGYDDAQEEYKATMGKIMADEQAGDADWRYANDKERELNQERQRIKEMRNRGAQYTTMRKRLLQQYPHSLSKSFDAYTWYEQNRGKFEHDVFVPLLHMRIQNADDSFYLENLISGRDFSMFIFGSKNDEVLLTTACNGQFNKISSTVVKPEDIKPLSFAFPPEFTKFGMKKFAGDLFSGPPAVRYYLCSTFKLHMVPIGDATAEKDMDAVTRMLQRHHIGLLLTDNYRIQCNTSRYSGDIVTQTQAIRKDKRILTCHDPSKYGGEGDGGAGERKLGELEEEMKKVTIRMDELKKSIVKRKDAARKEQMVWRERREKMQMLAGHYQAAKNTYDTEQANRPDVDSAKAAGDEKKKRIMEKEFKRMEAILNMGEERTNLGMRLFSLSMALEAMSRKEEGVVKERNERRERYNELREEVEVAERELRDVKKKRENATEELKRETGLTTVDEQDMNADEKKEWKKINKVFNNERIPDRFDDLMQEEANERGRMNLVQTDGNEKDVMRLDDLRKEHDDLQNTVDDQTSNKRERKEKFEAEIDAWLTPLKEIIANISRNYTVFFEKLKCTGEVQLDEPDNKWHVDKYGIEILVRFRAGERLRRLDHQVQSGGERSVSTMLYLLALQEECPVPFRCVDEINQGMDPTNERKVFDVMVEKLSANTGNLGKSQYFLLTPKLLHGLHFTPSVTVLIVHNGPTLSKDAYKWNPAHFLAIMRGQAVHRTEAAARS